MFFASLLDSFWIFSVCFWISFVFSMFFWMYVGTDLTHTHWNLRNEKGRTLEFHSEYLLDIFWVFF